MSNRTALPPERRVPKPVAAFGLGVVAALIALVGSAKIVGPLCRLLLGSPTDFGADYTSGEAAAQALASHCVSVLVAFVGVGALLTNWYRVAVSTVLAASNPIVMLLGVIGARAFLSESVPYEYVGLGTGSLLVLAGWLLGALGMFVGQFLGKMLKRRNSG